MILARRRSAASFAASSLTQLSTRPVIAMLPTQTSSIRGNDGLSSIAIDLMQCFLMVNAMLQLHDSNHK